MSIQPDLFTASPVIPTSPALPRAARVRLSRQNAAILERLRQGPMSNVEMALMSKKYTSRASEIRAYLRQGGEDLK
jgi:hypothetical protein